MTVTTEQKAQKKRDDEAARQARIKAAKARVAALPEQQRAAVLRRADELRLIETETRKPRASVAYLEAALAETAPVKPPRKTAEERAPAPKKQAKPPKKAAAKKVPAPRKAPAIKATVSIDVPGERRTCPRCQNDRPVADFKSYRSDCRQCYNERWREWDAKRKAAAKAAS